MKHQGNMNLRIWLGRDSRYDADADPDPGPDQAELDTAFHGTVIGVAYDAGQDILRLKYEGREVRVELRQCKTHRCDDTHMLVEVEQRETFNRDPEATEDRPADAWPHDDGIVGKV